MRGIEHTTNDIDAGIELLETIKRHLTDLHTLAYNRHAATQWRDKVNGGSRDYALDNHGDPEARQLLTDLSDQTRDLIKKGTDVAKAAKRFLSRSDVQRVHRRDSSADATLDEVIAALHAAARRRQNGEGHTTIVVPPIMAKGYDWHREYEALASAVRKVTPRFAADHAHCVKDEAGEYGRTRRISRRYSLELLSPFERQVWQRSLRPTAEEKAS